MNKAKHKHLKNYIKSDKKRIKGWFQRIDAEIIGALLEYQNNKNIEGACTEIGVHHGKSFIPLCLSLKNNEKALCIDIFDDQKKNLDKSGKGNLDQFNKNLSKHHIDTESIVVCQCSSEEISHDKIIEKVGNVRFFSVDGGHWKSIVINDLNLAEKTLTRDGVIALDDYCRADWPEVTSGYNYWQENTKSKLVPFAIGSNKLYICNKEMVKTYQNALRTLFLNSYFSKSYESQDNSRIDSYRTEFVQQDETSIKKSLKLYSKIFTPNLYIKLFQGKKRKPT